MRKTLFLLIVLFGCGNPKEKTSEITTNIEDGLIVDQVYFTGDKTYNIEERMKHYNIPGASIAVIENNKVVWSKAYGVMDRTTKEPVTTTTLFQAASISKPVSAYAALKTVEMGKLDLTSDINSFLTSWKVPDNEFTTTTKVNLTHLLSHTGGITVHGFGGYNPGSKIPTLVQVLDGAPPANSPPVRVDKEPGGSFRYSGGGYCITQQAMIDVHGKPFPQIMKELVLDPLGMEHSQFDQPLDEVKIKSATTGYLPDDSEVDGKRHTYPELAAAGLWTTPEDLAKFGINIQKTLKGESSKVLSKEMTDKMLTAVDKNAGVGLGIAILDRGGNFYFSHSGWNEGFSSEMIFSRDNGNGVVVMINSNKPEFIGEVIRSVARAYHWNNYVTEYNRMPADKSILEKAAGRYRNGTDGRITVKRNGDKLLFKYIRWDKPQELVRVTDSTYLVMKSAALVQFKQLPGDKLDLVISNDRQHEGSHPKVDTTEVIPYEYLLKGDFDKALVGYEALLKADPKDHSIEEANLNDQGYQQLERNPKLALNIFKVNTILYPNSFNVYDSYGDAQRANGDIEGAIESYKKVLKLNPKNEETAKKLKDISKK